MRYLRLILLLMLFACRAVSSYAQDDTQKFRSMQLSCSRVSQACTKCDDTLKKYFEKRGIKYPCADIYLRAFKSLNEMELWGRNDENSEYKLIKIYNICALSGILGPKRTEGDRQVPEGYYFIDEFNPKSDYYLSLLLNYPNYSDLANTVNMKPGGHIYIHGGCVTIGCMPLTNDLIQELYVVCMNAKLAGENYIPVHIFPIRYTRTAMNFLSRQYGNDPEKQKFWATLKEGYDYFEKHHKILPVMYTIDGKYVN